MTMKAIDLALVRIASFTCTALLLAACAQGPMTTASCSALPTFENYRAADAVTLPLRFENKMGSLFQLVEVCMSIDGHSIRQDDPGAVLEGIAAHRPLDLSPSLRPALVHRVAVVATFVGNGALAGYKFSVTSSHEIKAADLRPGVLIATFVERSAPSPEERPTIQWTDPAGVSVEAPPAS